MIQANLDSTVEIRESDRESYHVRMERVQVNPQDQKHPIQKVSIVPIRVSDFRKFFSGSEERKIRFRKAMGVDSITVVHDPTIGKGMPRPISGVTGETLEAKAARLRDETKKIEDQLKAEADQAKREAERLSKLSEAEREKDAVDKKIEADEAKIKAAQASELKSVANKRVIRKGARR